MKGTVLKKNKKYMEKEPQRCSEKFPEHLIEYRTCMKENFFRPRTENSSSSILKIFLIGRAHWVKSSDHMVGLNKY